MARNPISFEEALKQCDRMEGQEAVQLAEQERQEVIKRFPLDAWPALPLSRYALGQGNKHESFCWWLEFGTPHVGSIRGGSARKHIIYKQGEGEWWFDRQNVQE